MLRFPKSCLSVRTAEITKYQYRLAKTHSPTPCFVPVFRRQEKEGSRLNRANQACFLEFSQVSLYVRKCLLRVYFVVRGNPIRQLRCRMPVFKESPEASAYRIEGINRIEIANTLTNWYNYRLTSDFAGNDGRISGMANRCRI